MSYWINFILSLLSGAIFLTASLFAKANDSQSLSCVDIIGSYYPVVLTEGLYIRVGGGHALDSRCRRSVANTNQGVICTKAHGSNSYQVFNLSTGLSVSANYLEGQCFNAIRKVSQSHVCVRIDSESYGIYSIEDNRFLNEAYPLERTCVKRLYSLFPPSQLIIEE